MSKKTDWKKIQREYENTDITMKDLAKRHGVKTATLRSRKRRDGWKRKKNTQHVSKDIATQHESQRQNNATLNGVHIIQDSKLNDRQKKFCLVYLRTYNATQSYMQVYQCKYSTAKVDGPHLLSHPRIKEAISKLRQQQFSDLYLNANDILLQFAKQAFSDIGMFVNFGHKTDYDDDNNEFQRSYLYFKNQDEVDTSLIDSIHIGQNGAEIKLPDKQKALKFLSEHLPEKQVDNKDDNTFIKALLASEKRLNDDKKDDNK